LASGLLEIHSTRFHSSLENPTLGNRWVTDWPAGVPGANIRVVNV
jgi:hypothetical protein